jgi:hypothetical protein
MKHSSTVLTERLIVAQLVIKFSWRRFKIKDWFAEFFSEQDGETEIMQNYKSTTAVRYVTGEMMRIMGGSARHVQTERIKFNLKPTYPTLLHSGIN